jgi:hypothetical protein
MLFVRWLVAARPHNAGGLFFARITTAMKIKNAVLSALRHLLGIGAAYAIGRGWFSESAAAEIITGVVGVAAALWGVADEHIADNPANPV